MRFCADDVDRANAGGHCARLACVLRRHLSKLGGVSLFTVKQPQSPATPYFVALGKGASQCTVTKPHRPSLSV